VKPFYVSAALALGLMACAPTVTQTAAPVVTAQGFRPGGINPFQGRKSCDSIALPDKNQRYTAASPSDKIFIEASPPQGLTFGLEAAGSKVDLCVYASFEAIPSRYTIPVTLKLNDSVYKNEMIIYVSQDNVGYIPPFKPVYLQKNAELCIPLGFATSGDRNYQPVAIEQFGLRLESKTGLAISQKLIDSNLNICYSSGTTIPGEHVVQIVGRINGVGINSEVKVIVPR
jgi:hypothetical protein